MLLLFQMGYTGEYFFANVNDLEEREANDTKQRGQGKGESVRKLRRDGSHPTMLERGRCRLFSLWRLDQRQDGCNNRRVLCLGVERKGS